MRKNLLERTLHDKLLGEREPVESIMEDAHEFAYLLMRDLGVDASRPEDLQKNWFNLYLVLVCYYSQNCTLEDLFMPVREALKGCSYLP